MKLLGCKKTCRRPTGIKSVARTRPGSNGGVDVTTSTNAKDLPPPNAIDDEFHPTTSNSEKIDAYELRIEELGQLMLEQGRHLDELTNRSHRLSTENLMLREKVSSGLENLIAKPSGASMENKSPLNSMIRHQKKNQEDNNIIKKEKEENELLHKQAELLVHELAHSNAQISEMDMTIASLEKELKERWEQSRQCKEPFWSALIDINLSSLLTTHFFR
jgi:hypothetical protein